MENIENNIARFEEDTEDGEKAPRSQKIDIDLEKLSYTADAKTDIHNTSDRYVSDIIKVDIIPEKKGAFLKHTEYMIKSDNHNSSVCHRYSDFLSLYEYFIRVYEFRMVPRLPPKQIMLDAFLEERRSGLQRWLTLISQNPALSKDETLKLFLVRNSNDFPPLSYNDDEFEAHCAASAKYDNNSSCGGVEEIIAKREKVRKIMNLLLAVKRLVAVQTKRRCNQRKNYEELASVLNSISSATRDSDLYDFSKNFLLISKQSEGVIDSGVTERLELLNEVLIAFSDMCDRVVYQKQVSLYDEKNFKGFTGMRLKSLIRSNLTNEEEEADRVELQKQRVSFGIHCANDEFKLVQKYLKLLPSILLQFTYDEERFTSTISQILQNVIEIESDKLNS